MDDLNLTRDDFATGLREQQERELAKYETQFVFTPFQPAAINALDSAIPEGRIVAIDPPERRALAISLPEGVNILRREGPDKNVAIYLDEVAPIVGLFLEIYRAEGAVVVPVLKGMSGRQFEKLGINRIVFGESPLRTYRQYMERMESIKARAKDDEPGRVMRGIADAVLYSIGVAKSHAELVLQESHADMDSGKAGNPNAKRKYDRRDLRCIEFLEAVPREQAINMVAQQQQQSTAAIPALLERIAAQEERWAVVAEQMAAQTEALRAIAAGQGQQAKGKRDAA